MLVGRDAEQHVLDAVLAGARLGQSGVLIVTGEAGIGKTALLDQVRASAEDIQVLSVTGTEPERDLPFAGLAQLLRVTKRTSRTCRRPRRRPSASPSRCPRATPRTASPSVRDC